MRATLQGRWRGRLTTRAALRAHGCIRRRAIVYTPPVRGPKGGGGHERERGGIMKHTDRLRRVGHVYSPGRMARLKTK